MFLVGGYAQSLWLQEKIAERFSDRLKIILPDMAFVSVLRGAVMYDLNRSDTPAYKAKHSYAVGIIKPFVDNTHPIGKNICILPILLSLDIFRVDFVQILIIQFSHY